MQASPIKVWSTSSTISTLKYQKRTSCGPQIIVSNYQSELKNQVLDLKSHIHSYNSGMRFCPSSKTSLLLPGKTNPTTGHRWPTNNTTTSPSDLLSPWSLSESHNTPQSTSSDSILLSGPSPSMAPFLDTIFRLDSIQQTDLTPVLTLQTTQKLL